MSNSMITYKPWIEVCVVTSAYPYYNEDRFTSYDPEFCSCEANLEEPRVFVTCGRLGDHRVTVPTLYEVRDVTQFNDLVDEYCPAKYRNEVKHAFTYTDDSEDETCTYILFTGEREYVL